MYCWQRGRILGRGCKTGVHIQVDRLRRSGSVSGILVPLQPPATTRNSVPDAGHCHTYTTSFPSQAEAGEFLLNFMLLNEHPQRVAAAYALNLSAEESTSYFWPMISRHV